MKKVEEGIFSFPDFFIEESAKEVICALLLPNPNERVCTFDQITQFAFFEGIDWKNLHSQQPPIPKTYPGHSLGQMTGSILFEVFFDHVCPDSKFSWPIIQQVLNAYSSKMHLIIHIYPLPYHRNAFYATQAGLVIQDLKGEKAWFQWLDLIFQNQSQFYNNPTADMTSNDVIKLYAKFAGQLGIPETSFITGMTYGNQYDSDARTYWKYGADRGIYGTPEFYVNGVFVTDQIWSLQQWQQIFDAL